MRKICGVRVENGSPAERFMLEFETYLRQRGLEVIAYVNGRKVGSELDLYVVPIGYEKPRFQKDCNGFHVLNVYNDHAISGLNNEYVRQIKRYVDYMTELGQ